MKIDGAKILVTGGCGLVGSTTIDLLLREHDPARIVIVDNLERGTLSNVESALADPRVTLVRGDIRDVATMHEVTRGMDAVIHMATLRITACAAEPRAALGVVGVDLRPGRGVPHAGRPPSVQQPDLVRREQDHARGTAPLVQRHVRAAL